VNGNVWGANIEVTYDPETDTYRADYQPSEHGSLASVILYLVSTATGNDPETMNPLYDAVDPDALESLIQSHEGETGQIEFCYCGCEITVTGDGKILVQKPGDEE